MATFGNTHSNGDVVRHWPDWAGASWYPMNAENGQLTKISLKAVAVTVPAKVKVSLYSVTGDLPDIKLSTSDELTIDADAWYDFTISHNLLANTKYAFVIMSDQSIWVHYDAGGAASQWSQKSSLTYPNFPDPYGSADSTSDRMESIYGTYTPTAPPPPSAGVAGGGGFFLDTRYIGERIIEKAAKTAFVYGLNWLVSIVLDEDS